MFLLIACFIYFCFAFISLKVNFDLSKSNNKLIKEYNRINSGHYIVS